MVLNRQSKTQNQDTIWNSTHSRLQIWAWALWKSGKKKAHAQNIPGRKKIVEDISEVRISLPTPKFYKKEKEKNLQLMAQREIEIRTYIYIYAWAACGANRKGKREQREKEEAHLNLEINRSKDRIF